MADAVDAGAAGAGVVVAALNLRGQLGLTVTPRSAGLADGAARLTGLDAAHVDAEGAVATLAVELADVRGVVVSDAGRVLADLTGFAVGVEQAGVGAAADALHAEVASGAVTHGLAVDGLLIRLGDDAGAAVADVTLGTLTARVALDIFNAGAVDAAEALLALAGADTLRDRRLSDTGVIDADLTLATAGVLFTLKLSVHAGGVDADLTVSAARVVFTARGLDDGTALSAEAVFAVTVGATVRVIAAALAAHAALSRVTDEARAAVAVLHAVRGRLRHNAVTVGVADEALVTVLMAEAEGRRGAHAILTVTVGRADLLLGAVRVYEALDGLRIGIGVGANRRLIGAKPALVAEGLVGAVIVVEAVEGLAASAVAEVAACIIALLGVALFAVEALLPMTAGEEGGAGEQSEDMQGFHRGPPIS